MRDAFGLFRGWCRSAPSCLEYTPTSVPTGAAEIAPLRCARCRCLPQEHVPAVCDGYDPHSPEQLAEIAIGAARHVRRFGIEPKIALCSQSQFGNQGSDSGKRLRATLDVLDSKPRDFAYEGEMNVDTALSAELRERLLPDNRLEGAANILIFSNSDAASGVRNILKAKGGGLEVGPILMGMGNRAHIVTAGVTARGLLNMAAIAGTPVAHYG